MIDVKCKSCNKLLLKAAILVGAIKCTRCGLIFEYKILTNIHLTNAYDFEKDRLQGKLNYDKNKLEPAEAKTDNRSKVKTTT